MTVSALWIVASAVFGAIFGSFMNVVIFRLPRGLSISRPQWSFCPHCNNRISFRDNLPILGWLILRGRCRKCAKPIGIVYPIVEAISALVFLSLADALFVGKVVPLIGEPRSDWPIAVGYFVLFFSLLATSAMDIEAYSVDVRILVLAMVVGALSAGMWFATADPMSRASVATTISARSSFLIGTPKAPYQSVPPTGLLPATMALVGVAAGITWWVGMVVAGFFRRRNGNSGVSETAEVPDGDILPDSPSYLQTTKQTFRPFSLLMLVALIAGMTSWVVLAPDAGIGNTVAPALQRGMICLAVLMLMLLLASIVHRESDQQIIDEIEAERSTARKVAVGEAVSLAPAFFAGFALFLVFRLTGRLGLSWDELLSALPDESVLRNLVAGISHGLGALVWSAAIGWFVRIAGTLGFGKEAFGTGDIFIMAAIGAVMGVWGLVFTFFLAAVLAILGVVATSFWKSSRAVPFGPWLALGSFAAVWVFKDLLGFFGPFGDMLWSILCGVAH